VNLSHSLEIVCECAGSDLEWKSIREERVVSLRSRLHVEVTADEDLKP
jgi:hypothetical protein